MAKYSMLKVSDEVVAILKQGGRRCDSFLEVVAEQNKAVKNFCKHYNTTLKVVDVEVGRCKDQPMYGFSDGLGLYNIRGLRLEN